MVYPWPPLSLCPGLARCTRTASILCLPQSVRGTCLQGTVGRRVWDCWRDVGCTAANPLGALLATRHEVFCQVMILGGCRVVLGRTPAGGIATAELARLCLQTQVPAVLCCLRQQQLAAFYGLVSLASNAVCACCAGL